MQQEPLKPPPGVMEVKTLDDLLKGPPTKPCHRCGVINSEGAEICAWCGNQFPMPKK